MFDLYSNYPLLDGSQNIYTAIASLLKIPESLVSRMFKLHHQAINQRGKRQHKSPFNVTEPKFRKLMPLELFQIRFQLLRCKPFQFENTLQHIMQKFRYKIRATDLLKCILQSKSLSFRHMCHRLTKWTRMVLVEDESLRRQRLTYIRAMQEYHKKKQRIIHLYELYPKEKDTKSAILIAACVDGPIASVYIKNITVKLFIRWLDQCILDNIKEPCVFVFASPTFFQSSNRTPTIADSRQSICAWLKSHRIVHDEKLHKIELLDLVRHTVDEGNLQPEYLVDEQLKEKGHQTIYMPMDSSGLNPFEYILLNIRLKALARGTKSIDMTKELHSMANSKWRALFKRSEVTYQRYLSMEQNYELTIKHYHIDNVEYSIENWVNTMDVTKC